MTGPIAHRPLLALAGLCGALGVAAAAGGSHAATPNLTIAANFLLFHAPALMAIGLVGTSRVLRIAGWVLAAGLALFAGDLAMRALANTPLFPFAAPAGGVTLIAGWLIVAAPALLRPAGSGS